MRFKSSGMHNRDLAFHIEGGLTILWVFPEIAFMGLEKSGGTRACGERSLRIAVVKDGKTEMVNFRTIS